MRWAPIPGTSDFCVEPITATGTRRAGHRVSLHRDRCLSIRPQTSVHRDALGDLFEDVLIGKPPARLGKRRYAPPELFEAREGDLSSQRLAREVAFALTHPSHEVAQLGVKLVVESSGWPYDATY